MPRPRLTLETRTWSDEVAVILAVRRSRQETPWRGTVWWWVGAANERPRPTLGR